MGKLTTCATCGAEIARDADSCPQCGAKTATHSTTQIVMAVAVIIAVIAGVLEFMSRTQ